MDRIAPSVFHSSLRSFGLMAVLSGFVGVAGCTVGDQKCGDDFNYKDTDDECPYGPPGGPQKSEVPRGDCSLISFKPAGDAACATATFQGHVFPRMIAVDGGRCATATCHGTTAAAANADDVLLPEDDPDSFYNNLAAYQNDAGDPYIGAGNERAWMHCNVAKIEGGGDPMPKTAGLTNQADIDLVRTWMECGMENDGVPGGGGMGGGGGLGGAGGLGGLGGAGGGI